MTSVNPIKQLLILGGGSTGWMAASVLAQHFPQCQITLVEAEQQSPLGVGESTVPGFARLLQLLGLDLQAFMRETSACFKLGIEFVDWSGPGSRFFHPYGELGQSLAGQDFYQCWLKARSLGCDFPLEDFSPCAVMARQQRFIPPQALPHTPIAGANYALHLDALKLVDYLRRHAQQLGVKAVKGQAQGAKLSANGFIEQLYLADGRQLEADFFIDCSGFKAELLGKALGVGLDDWSAQLPCDSAVVVRTRAAPLTQVYTSARARKAGWSWRIPLQGATGHGYVFSSQFCSPAQAQSSLLRSLEGQSLGEPVQLKFSSGKRQRFWQGNCLALGLAAGFVEPLESTSLNLVVRALELFLRFEPDRACAPELQRAFNRRFSADCAEVRDFVLLHYCTSQRRDSPFWRHCAQLPLPDSLAERLALFKSHGLLDSQEDSLFGPSSWQSVLEGMGVRPHKYSPRVDRLSQVELEQQLGRLRQSLARMVKQLPSHDEYLQQGFAPEPGA